MFTNPVANLNQYWRHYALGACAAVVMLGLYGSLFVRLAAVWWTDTYAFYVPFVPLFSAFLMWQERITLRELPRRGQPSGLLLVVVALGLLGVGRQMDELALETASLVVMIWGVVLISYGWAYVRRLAFPLGFLACMLPFPPWMVDAVSLPLQHLTAWAGSIGLNAVGISTSRAGLLLYLPTLTLKVAVVCNGLKYLLTLVVFAVAFAHLTQPRFWQKVTLMIIAVPFALLINVVRVVGSGVLGNTFGIELITGMAHAYFGKAIYVAGLGLFVAVGLGLRRLGKTREKTSICETTFSIRTPASREM